MDLDHHSKGQIIGEIDRNLLDILQDQNHHIEGQLHVMIGDQDPAWRDQNHHIEGQLHAKVGDQNLFLTQRGQDHHTGGRLRMMVIDQDLNVARRGQDRLTEGQLSNINGDHQTFVIILRIDTYGEEILLVLVDLNHGPEKSQRKMRKSKDLR